MTAEAEILRLSRLVESAALTLERQRVDLARRQTEFEQLKRRIDLLEPASPVFHQLFGAGRLQACIGSFYRLDPAGNAVGVLLPRPSPQNRGQSLQIVVVSIGTVVVTSIDANINGSSTFSPMLNVVSTFESDGTSWWCGQVPDLVQSVNSGVATYVHPTTGNTVVDVRVDGSTIVVNGSNNLSVGSIAPSQVSAAGSSVGQVLTNVAGTTTYATLPGSPSVSHVVDLVCCETLTLSAPGANVHGWAPDVGWRVLCLAQSGSDVETSVNNGLWVWNGAAVPMTRPTDWTGTLDTTIPRLIHCKRGPRMATSVNPHDGSPAGPNNSPYGDGSTYALHYSSATLVVGTNTPKFRPMHATWTTFQVLHPRVDAIVTDTSINVAAPGTSTFEGVTLTAGNSVMLLGQTSGVENGPWTFNGTTVPMKRRIDFGYSGSGHYEVVHAGEHHVFPVAAGGSLYGKGMAVVLYGSGIVWDYGMSTSGCTSFNWLPIGGGRYFPGDSSPFSVEQGDNYVDVYSAKSGALRTGRLRMQYNGSSGSSQAYLIAANNFSNGAGIVLCHADDTLAYHGYLVGASTGYCSVEWYQNSLYFYDPRVSSSMTPKGRLWYDTSGSNQYLLISSDSTDATGAAILFAGSGHVYPNRFFFLLSGSWRWSMSTTALLPEGTQDLGSASQPVNEFTCKQLNVKPTSTISPSSTNSLYISGGFHRVEQNSSYSIRRIYDAVAEHDGQELTLIAEVGHSISIQCGYSSGDRGIVCHEGDRTIAGGTGAKFVFSATTGMWAMI